MNKNNWTAIIPAAGKGSRFDKSKNKIFFVHKKKSILEHMINKISNITTKIIIVINKRDYREAKNISKKFKKKNNIQYVFQNIADGMATAIEIGLRKTSTKFFYTIWCDQIGLSSKTIKETIQYHEKSNFIASFPAARIKNNYTLVEKNKLNYLKKIYQSREEKLGKNSGLNDCGFFCCDTFFFKKNLKKLISSKKIVSKKTREHDFIYALNYFAKSYKIKVKITKNKIDTLGVNFKKDILKLKNIS
jgi:bifunctional N-acetylglucosamine-1-phosphate-uridyltransferase/glucosamine-1-phosphate-acetyltransferase GlmU-like protein